MPPPAESLATANQVQPSRPIRRFTVAYLAASASATAAMLAVQTLLILLVERGWEAFHDFPSWIIIYSIYSLGYTLVLGVAGWGVLLLLRLNSRIAYAAVGGTLGFVVATSGEWDGLALQNPFLYSFTAAGVAAALTFRALYYRDRRSSTGSSRYSAN